MMEAVYADRVVVMKDGKIVDTIPLNRQDHSAAPLIPRLAELGL